MSESSAAAADDDPGVEALLRVNAELAAEIRGLREERIERPRSAAAPTGRRLGRLLADRDATAAERDRLVEELGQARHELGAQEARARAATERTAHLEEERAQLIQKLDEYGRLTAALQEEVGRLRGGLAGILRRGAARVGRVRRRSP